MVDNVSKYSSPNQAWQVEHEQPAPHLHEPLLAPPAAALSGHEHGLHPQCWPQVHVLCSPPLAVESLLLHLFHIAKFKKKKFLGINPNSKSKFGGNFLIKVYKSIKGCVEKY